MPKGKRKDRAGGRKAADETAVHSSSEDTLDNASVASGYSDGQAGLGDGLENGEVDTVSSQEDFEEKLLTVIDNLSDKSVKTRLQNLTSLRSALTKKYIPEFISNRKVTVTDALERCLKKGKSEEQAAAVVCLSLLVLQLTSDDEQADVMKEIFPLLKVIATDNSVSCKCRAVVAENLAVLTFVVADDIEVITDTMATLESIYRMSYLKGDGNTRFNEAEVTSMHCSAVTSWSLLLSRLSSFTAEKIILSHLPKMTELLANPDTELRIATGETLALMYEMMREHDQEFEGDNFDELCDQLKTLSTESHKYRAKKDRRQQKSSFREIHRAVELGDFSDLSIQVGSREKYFIETWSSKLQYDSFCHILGTGMSLHLKENDLLRQILGLGPALLSTPTHQSKNFKMEQKMIHGAAFKARTKVRSKLRDRKAGCVSGD